MGNCCRHQSSTMVWDGEDWGSLASRHRLGNRVMDEAEGDHDHVNGGIDVEKQRLLGEKQGVSSSASTREVKIKISKKELEELVQRVDMQGLTLEQVLATLIDGNDHGYQYEMEHHRHWRPVLQSIPEVN